ncbi:MAG: glycoside hydrolase family 3 C-terminal domain-containing protein [Firmicutes bacterium]|nr:glycoside hydrolase family 3 C-terminal domain-containing protein [Bacillota bacterium]MCM1393611.1 glycoside hydrolase family 3 C-terminal domain-containing protein [[Eubacterium] siraeum]
MTDTDYKNILDSLTLEEKASLCSGMTNWLTQEVERVGIPAVWVSDGPSGLRKEKVKENGTNVMGESEPSTCFPGAATLASSWDTELTEEVGKAIAEEAKALKVCTVLGPGVNIKRSPLCGRNFEYYSEDPYLAGRMGGAWVHGVEKENVGTSLKHFLANNEEHIRMTISSVVDERALREIYMPAFEHIVKEEQPATVMCSYNRLNGTYLSENKRMLTDVLRGEWGYNGLVVSDWGAVNNRVEGVKAGLDLEMPGNKGINDRHIVAAVKNGTLSEEDLNTVALRVIKFAFERKEKIDENYSADLEAHHRIARKAAANSAVLLKNDNGALPLKKEQKIAVIGRLAKTARYQGAGSSHINATKIVSFTDALDANGTQYEYADGYKMKGEGESEHLLSNALKIAKGKDAVVVFIGLTDAFESEGYDRSRLGIPRSHNTLVEELCKVNDNVIVVLSCGAPVLVKKWRRDVKAILNLYIGGQATGEAAYDLLYGNVNPSGKLAETFPRKNKENIVSKYFPMGPRTCEYRESIYVGYRYFDKADKPVRYPFGYGLSYTKFEYSDIQLSSDSITEGTDLEVSFKIKNVGDVAGAEVAQLYVSDVESTIFRPVKELKGFKKVYLEAGEEKTVTLTLDSRAFAYYNVLIKDWHIESGDFEILVGASSRDIRLKAVVNVTSANPDAQIPDYRESAPYYYDLKGDEIPVEQFEAIYGDKMPDNSKFKKGELTACNSVSQCAVSPCGRFISGVAAIGAKLISLSAENPEMITASVKDMPLRAATAMTGGLVPEMSLYGLVDMVNGRKGGLRKFIRGFKKANRNALLDENGDVIKQ